MPSSARQSVLSPRASAAGPGFELGEEGETWGVEVTEQDRAVWAAQEAMAERLPMVSIRRVLLDSIMLWTVGSCTVVHVSLDASAAAAGFELREEGETWDVEITEQDRAVWAAQELWQNGCQW